MILRDSGFETPGVCLVTSCCVWEFLSKNGVVMRPRRANGQNAAFGSHRPSPSITCHVGRPCTHYCFIICEANQLASPCDSALQQDDRCYNIINEYNILRTSLYYTNQPWHTFCPRARWEALSCGREPLCSHAIMPLLSM